MEAVKETKKLDKFFKKEDEPADKVAVEVKKISKETPTAEQIKKDLKAEEKKDKKLEKTEMAKKHAIMIKEERTRMAKEKRLEDAAKKVKKDKENKIKKDKRIADKVEKKRLNKIRKEEDRVAKEAIPISPMIAKLRAFIKSGRDYIIIGASTEVLIIIVWMIFGDAQAVMSNMITILKWNSLIALLYAEALFVEWYLSKIHGGK